jgi:predicted amidophosphoribosyltransferase
VKLYELGWQLLLMGEHCYLDSTDECYFTDDYESYNRLGMKAQILSLKRGNESVILDLARQLSLALPREWTSNYTFVPMPPSSAATNPLRRMLKQLDVGDSRDLLVQMKDTPPSHNGWRPMPEQRAKLLTLNELEVDPEPNTIVIVDDVLATGSHFRAAKMAVRRRWPHMRVIGVFLARVRGRRRASRRFEGPLGLAAISKLADSGGGVGKA